MSAAQKLSAFSSVTRAYLLRFGSVAIGEAAQSLASKGGVTEKSRQNDFLGFTKRASIADPTAAHIPVAQSNFLLACYTVSLISGDNILNMNLQSSTIRKYLTAVAKLYTDLELENPLTSSKIKTNYPEILLTALQHYEKIPDRCEVITDSMFEHIDTLAQTADQDSLISSFNDWLKWSRYSGPRLSEWCQTTKTKFKYSDKGSKDEPSAFTFDDILFFDKEGRLLDPRHHSFLQVWYAEVCWRWQKNDDNGEKIKYYRHKTNIRWCPCRPLWNVAQRALRWGLPHNEPLARYFDEKKGAVFFITDGDVNSMLQRAAREKLGITDEEVLSRWTTHSLRVTAANELHRLGFSDVYIKLRLRWKSDSFMKYLRHTIHIARQHTKAMALSHENLGLDDKSNLDSVNKKRERIVVYRTIENTDILWERQICAGAA